MLKGYILIAALLLIWAGSLSLSPPDQDDLPMKKIHKAISRVWKTEDFRVVEYDQANLRRCNDNGCWLRVMNGNQELGMVYVGRVNSCRSGGCAIDPLDEKALSFEYFDYFLLAETNGEVRWVKIFNYEATQGHEVMSRGWLNQFRGSRPGSSLVFGRDIEGLSGATVSASAITQDIREVLSCVSDH